MQHTLIHSLLIMLGAVLKGVVRIPLCVAVIVIGYYVWQQYQEPWDIAVGFPLMLLGISMGIFSVYDLVVALISSQWRRQHCPYCRSLGKVSDILSPRNDFHRRRA